MKIHVYFTPIEVDPLVVADATVGVVDVIRATSTMVEALANGAKAIYPTESTEDAIRLAGSLGRDDTLLCGERKGLKIDGFDLGNSPNEYKREVVGDKRLVMTTTNGTRAFLAAAGARRTIAASFLNLSAAAAALGDAEDLVVICAGKEDRFSLDDAVCAGMIVSRIVDAIDGDEFHLNDSAQAVVGLAAGFALDADFLAGTAAGEALVEVGLGDDLHVCAHQDRHDLVPEMHDRVIQLPATGT